MTRDDIVRMALEAGFQRDMFGRGIWDSEDFNRFAALVADAEREACAKVCEEFINPATDVETDSWDHAAEVCATAIRARGNNGENI